MEETGIDGRPGADDGLSARRTCKLDSSSGRRVLIEWWFSAVWLIPLQFGPNEDLESYPRDLEHDTLLIKECGGNLVFAPQPADMYGQGTRTWVTVEGLTKELCGRAVRFTSVVWRQWFVS